MKMLYIALSHLFSIKNILSEIQAFLDLHKTTSHPMKIKVISCSAQLSVKIKMPTIVDILTFISMINTIFESLKARKFIMLLMLKCQQLLTFQHLLA